MATGVISGEI